MLYTQSKVLNRHHSRDLPSVGGQHGVLIDKINKVKLALTRRLTVVNGGVPNRWLEMVAVIVFRTEDRGVV